MASSLRGGPKVLLQYIAIFHLETGTRISQDSLELYVADGLECLILLPPPPER